MSNVLVNQVWPETTRLPAAPLRFAAQAGELRTHLAPLRQIDSLP